MAGTDFRPPIRLEGKYVDMVPLDPSQLPDLVKAGQYPAIWTYFRAGLGDTESGMRRLVEGLLTLQEQGTDLPFTVVRRSDGVPIGMTRYLEIHREDHAVEVGGTWFTPACWRTPFNTDSKRRMLGYAFEEEGVRRVQLKTDVRNLQSRTAILRIGAVFEGVLREHILLPDGSFRSSAYYSVVASEWPAVRERLDAMLARPWVPSSGTQDTALTRP